MRQIELRAVAKELAEKAHEGYTRFSEEVFDEMDEPAQQAYIAALSSIAASSAELVCALLDRTSERR